MENAAFSSWFRGLKGRLLLIAFLPVIGFALTFTIAYTGFEKQSYYLNEAEKTFIPNLMFISEMRQARNKFAYNSLEIVTSNYPLNQRAEYVKETLSAVKEFSTGYDQYTKAPFIPGENEIHEKVKEEVSAFIKAMEQIAVLLQSEDPEKLKQASALLRGPFSKLNLTIRIFNKNIKELYEKAAKNQTKEAEIASERALSWMTYVTVVSTAGIFIVLLWIATKISNSINSVNKQLSEASFQVAASIMQLTESGNSLSHSTTESAASLEETVASIEELSSMVRMNSENAKQAAALSVESRGAAENGENEIRTLIQSMAEISTSSKKIEEIISVIDDIAFQINLLALNAAVEAARAGEQGKGFAVVAEAVRSLAQRSASSARDINGLIKDSVGKIHHGSEIADRSGTVLSTILNSVKKVSDLNNEIATASSEQTSGIQQISKAMNQLDQVSQANAASAEQISTTSHDITKLTTTTLKLTAELNKLVAGAQPGDKNSLADSDFSKTDENSSKFRLSA